MSNIRKSFSFREGVQVDNDIFVVRGSLVGIGTTIPTQKLDVNNGNVKVTGLITATDLFVTGFSTFNGINVGQNVSIGAGVITATAFYGDGATLSNLPTSQWVDVDVGLGFTSIYAQGFVGIGTDDPRYLLTISGNPEIGQEGIGIDTHGNMYLSGVVTTSSVDATGGLSNFEALRIDEDESYSGIALILGNDKLRISSNTGYIYGQGGLDIGIGFPATPNISLTNAGFATFAQDVDINGQLDVDGRSELDTVNISETLNVVGYSTFGRIEAGTVKISNGIVTATTFDGDLQGTSTSAQGLVGAPSITVTSVASTTATFTSLTSDYSTVSISTVSDSLYVGTGGTNLYVDSGNIGVGTDNPIADIELRKSDSKVYFIGETGSSQLVLGRGDEFDTNSSILKFASSGTNLEIVNNSAGSINNIINADTGASNFNWIYGGTNVEIMTLTYDGKLGLGVTNPDNTLHVVGTSTITSDLYVGGDVDTLGTITFGSGDARTRIGSVLDYPILYNTNVNNVGPNGISTFYDAHVRNNFRINTVAGTAVANLDVQDGSGLINNLSISTSSVNSTFDLYVDGDAGVTGALGINTTSLRNAETFENGVLQINAGALKFYTAGGILFENGGAIGFATDQPEGAIDLSKAVSVDGLYRSTFLPPILTEVEKSALPIIPRGAVLFNNDTSIPEYYNGSAWGKFGPAGWVVFDGTGGTGNVPATRSFNIGGINKTGTGAYTITFITPLSTNDYLVLGNADSTSSAYVTIGPSRTQNDVSITVYDDTGSAVDSAYICVALWY